MGARRSALFGLILAGKPNDQDWRQNGGYLKPSRRCPGWPGGLCRWHV